MSDWQKYALSFDLQKLRLQGCNNATSIKMKIVTHKHHSINVISITGILTSITVKAGTTKAHINPFTPLSTLSQHLLSTYKKQLCRCLVSTRVKSIMGKNNRQLRSTAESQDNYAICLSMEGWKGLLLSTDIRLLRVKRKTAIKFDCTKAKLFADDDNAREMQKYVNEQYYNQIT